MGDHVSTKNWRLSLDSVRDFCDVDNVNIKLRKFATTDEFNSLDEDLRVRAQVFFDAYDGKLED